MENQEKDLRLVIAKNIAELRKNANMTQLDLAEAMLYTDKAVSKWERGESVPDVMILKRIADYFHVTVDFLLEEEHSEPISEINTVDLRRAKHVRSLITGISVIMVWLLATFTFFVLRISMPDASSMWLSFIYAVPVSLIVWLTLNSVWFNRKWNYPLISLLMWSILTVVYLNLLVCSVSTNLIWLIFTLGVPGQVIILLWSGLGTHSKRKKH